MVNNELIERIKVLMAKLKVGSATAFAKTIGVPQTSFSTKLRGAQKMDSRIIFNILDTYPNVSCEWLVRGTGSIFLDGVTCDGSLDQIKITLLTNENVSLKRRLERSREEIDALQKDLENRDEQIRVLLNREAI